MASLKVRRFFWFIPVYYWDIKITFGRSAGVCGVSWLCRLPAEVIRQESCLFTGKTLVVGFSCAFLLSAGGKRKGGLWAPTRSTGWLVLGSKGIRKKAPTIQHINFNIIIILSNMEHRGRPPVSFQRGSGGGPVYLHWGDLRMRITGSFPTILPAIISRHVPCLARCPNPESDSVGEWACLCCPLSMWLSLTCFLCNWSDCPSTCQLAKSGWQLLSLVCYSILFCSLFPCGLAPVFQNLFMDILVLVHRILEKPMYLASYTKLEV